RPRHRRRGARQPGPRAARQRRRGGRPVHLAAAAHLRTGPHQGPHRGPGDGEHVQHGRGHDRHRGARRRRPHPGLPGRSRHRVVAAGRGGRGTRLGADGGFAHPGLITSAPPPFSGLVGAAYPGLMAWTGMSGIAPVPGYVVMQPTTLCNLDCTYCYLPHRALNRPMPVAVAADVNVWAAANERFSVVWHGGEPLAAGRAALADLMAPFQGVEHHIQTNATLIDDAWCEFFAEHDIRVSVSVDGPAALNANRVNRAGSPAYQRIERGIETLRRHGLPFSALCVVSAPRPGLAGELYDYFLGLG